jgi:hypothetical protein
MPATTVGGPFCCWELTTRVDRRSNIVSDVIEKCSADIDTSFDLSESLRELSALRGIDSLRNGEKRS